MRTRLLSLLTLLVLLGQPTLHAVAASAPWSKSCEKTRTLCGEGDGGTFRVGGSSSGTTARPGAGTSPGGRSRPVSLPGAYDVVQYVPACSGNRRGRVEQLCGAALVSCTPAGRGLVRYWVWVVTVDRVTGRELRAVQRPGTTCVGSAVAGVSPVAAIGALVAAEFQRLRVNVGRVTAEPGPRTLVNFETGFFTDASGPYALPAVTILGHRVVVTARPTGWEWFFGDGTRLRTSSPGKRGTVQVGHTYRDTGRVASYVVVTWAGTFTVDGGRPRAVVGTARTTGPRTALQVRQARAELVSR
ncbi:MAG: hypothetical protein JWN87_3070 [Frankiales bacterium]|nr:hypothetical protein [Frankiales bacterium]